MAGPTSFGYQVAGFGGGSTSAPLEVRYLVVVEETFTPTVVVEVEEQEAIVHHSVQEMFQVVNLL